jgi:hypothetical protein
MHKISKPLAKHIQILEPHAPQSFPPVMRKLRYVQLDQVDALFTQYVAAQLIVTSPLLPARHAAYGRPPIEKRYGLKVLTFAVLDNETQGGIEGIHRQASSRVSAQKRKPTLPFCPATK